MYIHNKNHTSSHKKLPSPCLSLPFFFPGGKVVVSYASVSLYNICMYISIYIPLANTFKIFLILKYFKYTEKKGDYKKNFCTHNPGLRKVNILPYFFRAFLFLKK